MRYNEKIMAILAGEEKFEYNFMEREIEDNPEFFYGLLFDENGDYNDQYIFKPWIFDKLLTSILRNSEKDYGYSYRDNKISTEKKELYFKNIAQLIVSKISDEKPNKKLVDLFNSGYSYINKYINISDMPILELMDKGYTFTNYCLYDFYALHNNKNIKLLFMMLKHSRFESNCFNKYIDTLDESDIDQLINLGYEIDNTTLNWYIKTTSKYSETKFDFKTFNLLVEKSNLADKSLPYEKLFVDLLYSFDYEMLKQFDFSKIDLNELINSAKYDDEHKSLKDYVLKKVKFEIFKLLVENGYKLDRSFFYDFIQSIPAYSNNIGNNSPDKIKFYVKQLKNSNLSDNEKNNFYEKAIAVATHFSDATVLYEILENLSDVELFEYGLQILIKNNDLIFFIYQLGNGYIPSKIIIRKIAEHNDAKYILKIIETSYPKTYEAMLPHLF